MTQETAFWEWFVRHQRELSTLEGNLEDNELVDELAAQMQKVNPHLTFEFGPKAKKREFVVSAGGIREAFPAVIALSKSAPPQLESWKVTAFRPRRVPSVTIEIRGKRVNSKEVEFSLLDNGSTAGLYLFIPHFEKDDVDLKQIGYLLLDETLGEYDVEARLGGIEMLSTETRTEGDRYPLTRLPALFDQLINQLEGRSGRPS